MHDGGARLVEDLAARGAHREREIGVLVVGRRVARVEAAELAEQRARNGEARAGAVVGLAQVVVLGLVRDRRRGRSSTRSRRATRCRPPPAAGRRDRSASRRRARRRDGGRRPRASASSQPGVTIVSLLRKTRMSPRASSAPRLHVAMKPRFASLRSKRTPVTRGELRRRGLGRRIVDDDHLVAPGGRCARRTLFRQVNVSSGWP